MRKLCLWIILLSVLMIAFDGCKKNPLKKDISKEALEVHIKRFDQDLFAVSPDSLQKYIPRLQKNYGEFFKIFTYKMIRIGGPKDRTFVADLKRFVTDSITGQIRSETATVFPDLRWLESDLTKAFRYYHSYFPEKKIPQVYSCISYFNQSIVVADGVLGISLDKYLGRKSGFYPRLELPVYKRLNMYKEKIVSDCMYAWAMSEFAYNDSNDNLMSQMVYQGKLMYFVDAMLPEVNDTLKIGYTAKQLNFCKKSEEGMWTFIVEQKHLFATEYMIKRRYIKDAPFTAEFTANSPGRVGVWIGWQIVRSYMKNNPEVTLRELMGNNNYQQILNDSGYSPHS
ncbi:MAG: gliding motility lipoprotein GldB [Bacteroidota bacterium]|nr:gliding motility lipoprotein GldB [Bacteroidota bacterium]MDP4204547.1 gliding motility lipoprotein GldB [Bacteroidota bacterium]